MASRRQGAVFQDVDPVHRPVHDMGRFDDARRRRGACALGSHKSVSMRANTAFVQANLWAYSPSADGQRFLVNELTEASSSTVNVITHWQQAAGAVTNR